MPKYHHTPKQIEVSNWIQNMGFAIETEVPAGAYCLDILVPELNWVVEIDNPSTHLKKRDAKRDQWLIENFGIKLVLRVDCGVSQKKFVETFNNALESQFGEDDSDGNRVEKGLK